jgi:uncharacterized protein
MAGTRKHALLDHPGIRPDFEHVEIVIGFENQAIGFAQMDLNKLRHIPKIRANGDLAAVGTKRKPDRIGSVVRNREGVHIDVANGKALARLDGLDTAKALAERLRKNAPKLAHRGFGYIERGLPDTENLREAIAMVGVFVGDQDGIEVADVRSNGGKARQGFAFSKPGVNEDAGAVGFEQCEIARAAGRKNRDAQTDGNCPLQAATGLEGPPRSAPPNFQDNGRARRQRQCRRRATVEIAHCVKPLIGPRTVTAIVFRLQSARDQAMGSKRNSWPLEAYKAIESATMSEQGEKPECLERLRDAEMETLGEILDQLADDGAMDLEELDGFFAALHCCPELVLPSEFLGEVFGDGLENGDVFPNIKVVNLAFSLLMNHWNAVGQAFASEDFFLPLMLEDDESKTYGNNWAIGFLRGVELRKEAWKEVLEDENKMGWFVPIFALAYENDPDPKMRPYKKPMTDAQREKLLAGLSVMVTEMYRYFAPHRRRQAQNRNQPRVRRENRKIGRNDPCYCGSGKKYKKCCGATKVN